MKTYPAVAVLTLGIFFMQGCTSSKQQSVFQTQLDTLGLTINQVRIANRERAIRIASIIEQAADSIRTTSQNTRIRQNALQWKISVVPAFRQVLLFTDPVAASVDGQAFAVQMRHYLEEGAGNSLFGDRQDIAVRAAHTIEAFFISTSDTNNATEVSKRINRNLEEWAREHPIDNRAFNRESVIPYLEKLRIGYASSVFESVGDIAENVSGLSNRVNLYAAQLPSEVRWQAEYVIADMRVEERLDSIQRQAAFALASVERLTRTIASGNLTLDIRSLQKLHDDIGLLKQWISVERGIALGNAERQRLETLQELQRLADQMLEKTSGQATVIVDHLMFRIAQLVALLVVIIILCGVIVLRLLRTKRSLSA
jgi:hypothetical protein